MNIGSFRLPFSKKTQNVMHQDLEASETISNFLLSHIPIKLIYQLFSFVSEQIVLQVMHLVH